MYASARLGGLIAGVIAGGLTSFIQLIVFVSLYFFIQGIFTILPADPTARQTLLFNLIVYAIPISIILFRGGFSDAGSSRSSAFFSSFIVTFPLPAIWLAYAWQSHGASV
jgi:hypothetical protein